MTIRFDSKNYFSIPYIKTYTKAKNKIIKLWGHISELEGDELKKDSKGGYKVVSSVYLTDDRGKGIRSLPISKKRYLYLEKKIIDGEPIEIIAEITKVKIEKVRKNKQDRYENQLKILRVRSGDEPLRILRATKKEVERVEAFFRIVKKKIKKGDKWFLLNAIKETLINILEIVPNERISDTLDAMILQAVSCGTIKTSSGKIHVCLIGHSASGKKLMFYAGELMNIITHEAQPGSVTPVGLTGACSVKNGVWSADKGSIAFANKGLFGIQDFDKCSIAEKILEVFSPVMEEKKVIIDKAAKRKFLAETGIYIDLNRASDLELKEYDKAEFVKETKLKSHIISRFDYICEFIKDVKGQMKSVEESLRKKPQGDNTRADYVSKYCQKNKIEVGRFLKLISGYLIERFYNIDTEPETEYIRKRFIKIRRMNKDNIKNLQDVAQFYYRYRNAILKFSAALSRIQLRKTTNRDAVDRAFDLLSWKWEALKGIAPLKGASRKGAKMTVFKEWLDRNYNNKEFEFKKGYKKFIKDECPGGNVEERQFYNRVNEFADIDKAGILRIKK